jgi:hypothetical protein
MQPTPVPTPTGQPITGSTTSQSSTDWNTQWNQIWNQAWNAGYNNGARPSVDSSFQSAVDQGYSAGQSARGQQSSSSSGGQVQGASTSGGGSSGSQYPLIINTGSSGTSAADEEAQRREAEARAAIEGGYAGYQTGLQGLQSSYETGKQEELGSAAQTYEQIFGGLSEQKAANLEKLEAGKGAVNTRQAQSIQDLQQNLSNVLRGATMQFGAMGAGDTSATRVMLPYAYTKLAGVQEGGIRRQANDQLFQIDQQARDTELQYSQMWRQSEVDKENQLQTIRNYYGDAIRNVQTAMAQAPLDKARDLASLSQALLSEAQSNLRQLEAESRQRVETIKNWAIQRMSELNNLKLQLQGSANFQPQDILWSELKAVGAQPATSGQEAFYNPMLLASKKRTEYLGQ